MPPEELDVMMEWFDSLMLHQQTDILHDLQHGDTFLERCRWHWENQ